MNFNRVFHYKPSILGYHYFWKHPNVVFWTPFALYFLDHLSPLLLSRRFDSTLKGSAIRSMGTFETNATLERKHVGLLEKEGKMLSIFDSFFCGCLEWEEWELRVFPMFFHVEGAWWLSTSHQGGVERCHASHSPVRWW